ncbi:MAG: hypothetical protein HY232_11975, partial [Acidobacteria bacterium]|nr:hypothetical protein [Acidobacteriota bacterium]
SPDGAALVSGSEDSRIKLWNAEDGTVIRTLTDHRNTVNGVRFSPDGTQLASGSRDRRGILWGAPAENK